MRKTFLPILIGSMLAAGVAAQSGRRGMTPPPTPPPEKLSEPPIVLPDRSTMAAAELTVVPDGVRKHQLQALDKGSFSLADFGGKVLVVNLWASWCGPCRREVPEYEKVRKEFAGREVEFIGLTAEDPRTSSERVRQFARDLHFGFRLGWADRETASALMNGRNAIPQTLVIAPDGRILDHWRGYSAAQGGRHLRETIEHALSGTGPAAQR